MSYILEVCADSVRSAVAAQEGGADRIELCSALVIGGLSPSVSMFRQVKENTDIKVRVLLRPRFGDFCYDDYEFETLREEVAQFCELGADGVGITMHRAFDVCRDPYEALEQCISLGIDTILTSGQKSSAWEGRELLAGLVDKAKGRIDILAGAGINPDVIEKLAPYTGVKSFHMSGKKVIDSKMEFRREGVPMGIPGFSEFEVWQTDTEQVKKAVKVFRSLSERQ